MIDYKQIAQDISKNENVYNAFFKAYPQQKEQLDEIKKSPSCGSCLESFLRPVLDNENIQEVLDSIYGKDNDYNLVIPRTPSFRPEFDVVEVDPDKLGEWLEQNNQNTQSKRIHQFDTCLNTKKNKVIVSRVILRMVSQ